MKCFLAGFLGLLLVMASPLHALSLTLERGFTLRASPAGGQTYTLADVIPAADTPVGAQAEAWLRQALAEAGWKPQPVDHRPDRYGRLRARFEAPGRPSLAESLVREGLAWVAGDIPDATRARALLAIEAEARQARRGLWKDWEPIPFAQATQHAGRFGLVVGRVRQVDSHKGHRFLAFGEDWRTDPTGFIPASVASRFENLEALAGRDVRLRGWIEEQNGPSILLVQPYAIEVLP